jgi:two-component system cell cycle sensor histidine kinase/response regulator CckA
VPLSRTQIEQIIVNLVINSLDAIGPGGRIRVETHDSFRGVSGTTSGDPRPDGVMLVVADTGAGIAPEVLPHVFDLGFSTKAGALNLGMGLGSVLRIIDSAGGTIDVESEAGRGTAVRMWLPLVADMIPPEVSSRQPEPEPPTGTELLLLVEDDRPVRNRVAGILRGAGYRVAAFENGAEAALAGQDLEVDGVVTDVSIPGLGGVELGRALRQRRPGVPVLFISGFALDGEVEAFESPARWLRKPFTRVELLLALRGVLDERPAAAAT